MYKWTSHFLDWNYSQDEGYISCDLPPAGPAVWDSGHVGFGEVPKVVVNIVASGHGLVKKYCPMVKDCVLCTLDSPLIVTKVPSYWLNFQALLNYIYFYITYFKFLQEIAERRSRGYVFPCLQRIHGGRLLGVHSFCPYSEYN